MGAPWKLAEARLVQVRSFTSAAAALFMDTDAVPAGKIWNVIGFRYMPSTNESQVVSFEKQNTASAAYCMLLNPQTLNLYPGGATFIEQGMEVMLLPGEYIRARRYAATAGSTMGLVMQFIEIDLPLYTYDEPQIVKRQDRALSSIRESLAGVAGRGSGGATSGGGASPPGSRGGGRTGGRVA